MSSRFTLKLYHASSLLCLAGIALPATGFADDAPVAAASSARTSDADSGGLEEVVVTANKIEEASSKVGATIQTIDTKALEQQHITTLQDLANVVPGLQFTETEFATPVYTLRGVGFYENSLAAYPDVSVYLDQAPLPLPAQTELTLFDIQRVEVLKGPQGTLFGNNATGGAINYIANKPTRDFTAGTQVSYGKYNTGQVDGFVSGPLGDTLLGRFAFSTTESADGWQHSQTRDDRNGKQNKIAARAILDWHPVDTLRLELNVNGWYNGSQPQQPQLAQYKPGFTNLFGRPNLPPIPTIPLATAPIGPNDSNVADWSRTFGEPRGDDALFQTFIRADYDLTPTITVTSISNYIYYSRNDRPDEDGSQYSTSDETLNKGYINSFSEELRVAGGGTSPLKWLAGVNYSGDRVREQQTFSWPDGTTHFAFPGSLGNTNDSTQKMDNYAVFAHADYNILDQLKLKAGVRGTEADRSIDECGIEYTGSFRDPDGLIQNDFAGAFGKGPVAPGECAMLLPTGDIGRLSTHLNERNLSWSGGLDWQVTDTLLAYANISRGFKAGGFPTLPASFFTALEPVTQEKVTDYETGFKAQFLGRRLLVNGAAFYYDYTDKQLKSRIIDPTFGALTALVNIPKSTIRGAELEVHSRPLTGLDLGLAATFLDAKIDRFSGVNQAGEVGSFAGSSVPYTPKWTMTSSANYEHPFTDQLAGFAGAQVSYQTLTSAAIGSPSLYLMPAYALVNLQLGVQSQDGRWRAYAWGKNVLNRFYVNNVVEQVDAVFRYTGRPATYGVAVSYRFK
jgi:outer membrane receptor protein involved in Fe transport